MDVVPSGNNYIIYTWVGTCNTSMKTQAQCNQQVYGTTTTNHVGTLSDTKKDFSGANNKLSTLYYTYITDTLVLSTAQKKQFTNFMWGITSGSGVATQQIDFRNIGLSLR